MFDPGSSRTWGRIKVTGFQPDLESETRHSDASLQREAPTRCRNSGWCEVIMRDRNCGLRPSPRGLKSGAGQDSSFALSTAHQVALQPLRSTSAQPKNVIVRPQVRAVKRGQPLKDVGQRALHHPFRPDWISCGYGMSLVRYLTIRRAQRMEAIQRPLLFGNVFKSGSLA